MYRTSDLYLAAYLKTKRHVVSCDREGRRCFFVFDGDPKDDIDSFFNGGMVKVGEFKSAIQDLKTMIFRGDK